MRYVKLVAFLAVVVAALLVALPAFADDPFGGPPSVTSGDGATTWGAIYVGNDSCWTGPVAPGTSLWFKADTWPANLDGVPVTLLVWLDDELPGATRPSGSAILGTAYDYFAGTPDGFDSANRLGDQEAPFVNGFAFRVFDPDALAPNYYYPTPNMWLLTTANGTASNGSVQPEGWGSHNLPGEPNHLLWYEGGAWSGWAYVQVFNQMLQSGTFTICTQKHLRFDHFRTPTPTDPAAIVGSADPSVPVTTSLQLKPIPASTATPLASPTESGGTQTQIPLQAPIAPSSPTTSATTTGPDETPDPMSVGQRSPTSALSAPPTPATPAPPITGATHQAQSQTPVPDATTAPSTNATSTTDSVKQATTTDSQNQGTPAPTDSAAPPVKSAVQAPPAPVAPPPSEPAETPQQSAAPAQAPPPPPHAPQPTPTSIPIVK